MRLETAEMSEVEQGVRAFYDRFMFGLAIHVRKIFAKTVFICIIITVVGMACISSDGPKWQPIILALVVGIIVAFGRYLTMRHKGLVLTTDTLDKRIGEVKECEIDFQDRWTLLQISQAILNHDSEDLDKFATQALRSASLSKLTFIRELCRARGLRPSQA
jgi:hypothetical protein